MGIEKYQGIIPAFYACYDKKGAISPEAVRQFAEHLIGKGVKGLYVGGSSGECIYQTKAERKLLLENVMAVAKGRATVIAHVACNNTAESMELAAHAESVGVDAIAAIPPIYFHLPEHAIAQYWNDISSAAPNTDFFIYNIPQLAGVALTVPLFKEMLKNPRVVGVKNSSPASQDIWQFKTVAGEGHIVFNGPDKQLLSGLACGADGGIGGTYAVMPELYIKIMALAKQGDFMKASALQSRVNAIVKVLDSGKGNLYAVEKEVLRRIYGLELGGVRKPLPNLFESDGPIVEQAQKMVEETIAWSKTL